MDQEELEAEYDATRLKWHWERVHDQLESRYDDLPRDGKDDLGRLALHHDLLYYLVNSLHSVYLDEWRFDQFLKDMGVGDWAKWMDLGSSVIYLRLAEAQIQTERIIHLVASAAYHTAIRELRFLVDTMVVAYRADMESEGELEAAIEWTREHGTSGTPFRRHLSGIELSHKQEIAELFSDLSDYVHPTHDEFFEPMLSGKHQERLFRKHDPDLLQETLSLADRTTDAVMYLVLRRFHKAVPNFVRKEKVEAAMRQGWYPLTRWRLEEPR